jgi:hypothetical protein
LKKVRFKEHTTNDKSDKNKRLERVDYRRKREINNRNEDKNGVGPGKSNPINRG